MCGIVGYVGKQNATDVLIDGLRKLEYRGYDSAGIAVFENHKIVIEKAKGRLDNLEPVSYTHLDVYKRQILDLSLYAKHMLYKNFKSD